MDHTTEKIEKLPTHVTIIMDGNGRWAKQRGLERIKGHQEGVESVRACCEMCVELGIKYMSVFAFSTENWGRPKEEIEGLWSIMIKAIAAETPTFQKQNVRFRVMGNLEPLSPKLRKEIVDCMNLTASNTGTQLIVMLNYSGKWDIVQACNKFKKEHPEEPIAEDKVARYLSTADIPDPDLLIRTSGEERISNYMLWQTAYTEFYFTYKLWPDFRKPEFRKALEAFAHRERRFGKV